MKVGLLTPEQKDLIDGQEFVKDNKFKPFQDKHGNWVISTQEIEFATIPPYDWVKDLPLIDYEPIETE